MILGLLSSTLTFGRCDGGNIILCMIFVVIDPSMLTVNVGVF